MGMSCNQSRYHCNIVFKRQSIAFLQEHYYEGIEIFMETSYYTDFLSHVLLQLVQL